MKAILVANLLMLILSQNLSAQRDSTFKEFYPNGKIRSITHEGIFNGCYMPIGTDSFFYQSGKLDSIVFYDNRASKTQPGCHEGWTTAITKKYFSNGKLKMISKQKYGYEGVPCDCGNWIWYNEQETILKKRYFGKCYDQKYCEE